MGPLEKVEVVSASMDEAVITFVDSRPFCWFLSGPPMCVASVCEGCPLKSLWTTGEWFCEVQTLVSSRFALSCEFQNFSLSLEPGDRGEYLVNVSASGLSIETTRSPNNVYVPIAVAAVLLIGAYVVVRIALVVLNRVSSRLRLGEVDQEELLLNRETSSFATQSVRSRIRLLSVDAMRGICLACVVFGKAGGGGYWFFDFSPWNGLSFADVIFPFFIFVMGVSATIANADAHRKEVLPRMFLLKALRRSLILFAVGIFLSTNNGSVNCFLPYRCVPATDLSQIRIPGVLQRCAVTSLAIASLTYLVGPRDIVLERCETVLSRALVDIVSYRSQWCVVSLLLFTWIGISLGLARPGCPAGYLGPGGISNDGKEYNCTGGIASFIDSQFFGDAHLNKWGTFTSTYFFVPFVEQSVVPSPVAFDQEGLLGTLNSIVMCYWGVVAGRVLGRSSDRKVEVCVRLFVYGAVLCLIGGFLSEFRQSGGLIPVNKNLWSTSFVFICGGFAMWLLGALYLVVDALRVWEGKPFVFLGVNSLIIYVANELLVGNITFHFDEITHSTLLFSSIVPVLMFILFAYWLDCHKLYLAA